MLYKEIPVDTSTFDQFFLIEPNLTKIADYKGIDYYYAPEIIEFVKSYKPIEGIFAIVVGAQGAAEYWGCNSRYDLFPEDQILGPTDKWGYLSFYNANVYTHHNNKDPNRSFGHVEVAVYNPVMHRIELIILIEEGRAPNVRNGDYYISQLKNRKSVNVSMGCKVPYDVCSICGNKSKTTTDRCYHIKYELGKLYPDGTRVCMINHQPKYFDISLVKFPADTLGRSLLKVASDELDLYDELSKLAGQKKIATHIKFSPGRYLSPVELLKRKIPNIKKSALDALSIFNLKELIGSMIKSKVLLKPEEFQYLLLKSSGMKKLGEDLWNRKLTFEKQAELIIPETDVNEDLGKLIKIVFQERVATPEGLGELIKMASEYPPINKVQRITDPTLDTLGKLYGGYKELLKSEIGDSIIKTASVIDLVFEQIPTFYEDIIDGF